MTDTAKQCNWNEAGITSQLVVDAIKFIHIGRFISIYAALFSCQTATGWATVARFNVQGRKRGLSTSCFTSSCFNPTGASPCERHSSPTQMQFHHRDDYDGLTCSLFVSLFVSLLLLLLLLLLLSLMMRKEQPWQKCAAIQLANCPLKGRWWEWRWKGGGEKRVGNNRENGNARSGMFFVWVSLSHWSIFLSLACNETVAKSFVCLFVCFLLLHLLFRCIFLLLLLWLLLCWL